MERQRHPVEFKREVARLMIMDGLSAPEVCGKLDVNPGLQVNPQANQSTVKTSVLKREKSALNSF